MYCPIQDSSSPSLGLPCTVEDIMNMIIHNNNHYYFVLLQAADSFSPSLGLPYAKTLFLKHFWLQYPLFLIVESKYPLYPSIIFVGEAFSENSS